jgi:ferritin-like metal-binding protein YciE
MRTAKAPPCQKKNLAAVKTNKALGPLDHVNKSQSSNEMAGPKSCTSVGGGIMPTIDSLTDVLVSEVRDLYDAEKRLTTAIPRLAKKAADPVLRTALTDHLRETKGQVRRLEQVFRHLGLKPRGKPCAGMRGIVEEGSEHTSEEFERDDLRDAVIIGSAIKVEHYEMASYMGAISHSTMLGLDEVTELLTATLTEEEAADKKLRAIGEGAIDLSAPLASVAAGLSAVVRSVLPGPARPGNGAPRHKAAPSR